MLIQKFESEKKHEKKRGIESENEIEKEKNGKESEKEKKNESDLLLEVLEVKKVSIEREKMILK